MFLETQNKVEATEQTQVQAVPNDALSLIIKAEIDTKISTAKAFPRSIDKFMKGAMSMATVTEDVAASCGYSVSRAGGSITGASVRLAEIVCANYGNLIAGTRVIANDGKTVTAQGFCHDLEANYSVQVEVKRRITNKYGQTFSEDMQVVTGNAACAIAYRNAVFKVVPASLIESIYERTREIVRGSAETLAVRRTKAMEYFKGIGVSDKQVFDKLGVRGIDDIDLHRLVTLTGLRSSIKNGEETIAGVFHNEDDVKAQAKTSKDAIKDIITKAKPATKAKDDAPGTDDSPINLSDLA